MASPYKPQIVNAVGALEHPLQIPGKIAKTVVGGMIPDPYTPAPPRPVYGPDVPTRSQARLSQSIATEQAPPAPEPELGSPENPGFMSKLPTRLPPSLRGDPFAPPSAETAEAGRQASAGSSVAIVPEPRAQLPGDRPGSAWSLTRTEGLPEAAQRGQPGAADVLRQIKPTLVIPRGADIDAPSMAALRQSLGVTQSIPQGNLDPFAPPPPGVPQGNPSPFSPMPSSATEGWFRPTASPPSSPVFVPADQAMAQRRSKMAPNTW
jgi:hypothetical protein